MRDLKRLDVKDFCVRCISECRKGLRDYREIRKSYVRVLKKNTKIVSVCKYHLDGYLQLNKNNILKVWNNFLEFEPNGVKK